MNLIAVQQYRKEKRGILAKSLSWFLIFLLTFCFTVNLGHTQQSSPKPPQEWQLTGIMAALDDPDPQIWILALNKLSEFKIDELEIPQPKYKKIVGLLSDENDPFVQSAAARALGQMGKLLETSNSVSVLIEAARTLGQMGEAAQEYAPQLLKLFETSNNLAVQQAAVIALGQMGEANIETILSILNAVYGNKWQGSPYRFLAYQKMF